MNMNFNYHHLYYFMIIAKEGSVSKAAEVLRVGQPTLSAQLKIFEETLSVALFERRKKRLYLTEQGKIAFDYAKNIFKLGSEMYEALHDRLMPTRPNIKIGALDSVAKQVLLQVSQKAYQFANCHITTVEDRYENLLFEVLSHKMDLAIANFEPRFDAVKNLHIRRLSQSQVCVYGAHGYLNLRKNFPVSLVQKPFVLPTHDSSLRSNFEAWLEGKKIHIDVIGESQDSALKIQMAIQGVAMIIAPQYAVAEHLKNKELYEIGQLLGLNEDLFMISAKRKIENPVALHLMKNFKI